MKSNLIFKLITVTIVLLPTIYGMEPEDNSRFRQIDSNHILDVKTGKTWWRPELPKHYMGKDWKLKKVEKREQKEPISPEPSMPEPFEFE